MEGSHGASPDVSDPTDPGKKPAEASQLTSTRRPMLSSEKGSGKSDRRPGRMRSHSLDFQCPTVVQEIQSANDYRSAGSLNNHNSWHPVQGEYGSESFRFRSRTDAPHGGHRALVGQILFAVPAGSLWDGAFPHLCPASLIRVRATVFHRFETAPMFPDTLYKADRRRSGRVWSRQGRVPTSGFRGALTGAGRSGPAGWSMWGRSWNRSVRFRWGISIAGRERRVGKRRRSPLEGVKRPGSSPGCPSSGRQPCRTLRSPPLSSPAEKPTPSSPDASPPPSTAG